MARTGWEVMDKVREAAARVKVFREYQQKKRDPAEVPYPIWATLAAANAFEADIDTLVRAALAEPEDGWVSAEERLPPNHLPVLVHGGCASYDAEQRVWRTLMEPYARHDYADARTIEWPVTYWRPLPEPPEGK